MDISKHHSHVSLNKIAAVTREESIELSCFLFWYSIGNRLLFPVIPSLCVTVTNYFVAVFYSLIKKTEFKLFFALIIYQTCWIAQISYLFPLF